MIRLHIRGSDRLSLCLTTLVLLLCALSALLSLINFQARSAQIVPEAAATRHANSRSAVVRLDLLWQEGPLGHSSVRKVCSAARPSFAPGDVTMQACRHARSLSTAFSDRFDCFNQACVSWYLQAVMRSCPCAL